MDPSAAILPARAAPDERRMHRMNLFLFLVALVFWWEAGYRQGASFGSGLRMNLAVAATLMVLMRLAASAVEALAYRLWWRTRGARLPYARFLVALIAISLVDRFGQSLFTVAGRDPSIAPWLAPIAGVQLLKPGLPYVEPGLWAAFGGLGLLTLARILLTAWFQSLGTGRRLRGPLALTTLAWLVTRVAVWWTVDLARGMSPLR